MSVKAVNWALEQKGLKPAEKLVLISLADRHNKDSGACFPSQATLAEDACLSRSSLNDQLDVLEGLGFFTREAVIDPATKRQRATQYHLNIGHSVSEIATREIRKAVSEKRQKPCPKNEGFRVRNSDTNQENITKDLTEGSGVRERDAFEEFRAELEQILGSDELLTAEGIKEARGWFSALDPSLILLSVSEQKAEAAGRIRVLKYFTPALKRLAEQPALDLGATAPARKASAKRDINKLMETALSRLSQEGSYP